MIENKERHAHIFWPKTKWAHIFYATFDNFALYIRAKYPKVGPEWPIWPQYFLWPIKSRNLFVNFECLNVLKQSQFARLAKRMAANTRRLILIQNHAAPKQKQKWPIFHSRK